MEVPDSERRTRRMRLPRRWWARLAVAAVVVGAIGVPVAWAGHTFSDVPDSSPHHDDVSALAGAGITGGCAPGLYCPTAAVRRDQMASFLRRGLGRTAFVQGADDEIPDTGRDLAVVVIDVGGAAGQWQFVKLDGVVTTYADNTGGCPCTVRYRIYHDGAGEVNYFRYNTLDDDELGYLGLDIETGATTAAVPVPSGTTQTFRIVGERVAGGHVGGFGELTAITAPFGSTGTNTLGIESTAKGGRISSGR